MGESVFQEGEEERGHYDSDEGGGQVVLTHDGIEVEVVVLGAAQTQLSYHSTYLVIHQGT